MAVRLTERDAKINHEGTKCGTITSSEPYPSQSHTNGTAKYEDPYQEESKGSERSHSISGGRALPTGETGDRDSRALSISARPPSIIDLPFPTGPLHYPGDVEAPPKEERRKLRRRRIHVSQSDLLDSKTENAPVRKAKSLDDLLNDDIEHSKPEFLLLQDDNVLTVKDTVGTTVEGHCNEHTDISPQVQQNVAGTCTTDTTVEKLTKDPIPQQRTSPKMLHFRDHFNDKETGSPDILQSPSLLFKPVITPVQATSKSHDHDACLLVMSNSGPDSSRFGVMSRHESQAKFDTMDERVTKMEEELMSLKLSQQQDSESLLLTKCTKHEIMFDSIAQSMKEKRCPSINSTPFYTGENGSGYKMCVRIYPNGDGKGRGSHLSVFLILMKGEYDNTEESIWPFNRRVIFQLIDHSVNDAKDIVTVISPGTKNKDPAYQKPSGKSGGMNIPTGFPQFVSQQELFGGGYVVDDSITLWVIVDSEIDNCSPQIPEHCSEK